MKRFISILLTTVLVAVFFAAVLVPSAAEEAEAESYAERIAALAGEAKEGTLFTTALTAERNSDMLLTTLTLSGMKAADKIIGFQIPLYYDAERLEPDLSDVDGEALNCMKNGLPGKHWENLTSPRKTEKNGKTYVYLQAGTAKTDYCKDGEDVVFTLNFKMKEGFDESGVWVAGDTTLCFVDDGLMTKYPGVPSYALSEPIRVQPQVLEGLPEGSQFLDRAGFAKGAYMTILAGDGQTVAQLTERGCGEADDLSYCFNVLVGADGKVLDTDFEKGKPCSFVCPEGGYILSINCGKEGAEALTGLKKGSTVTLYNVDLDKVSVLNGSVELTGAGFTFADPAFTQGDINGDGEVDSKDYFVLKKIILGIMEAPEGWEDRLDVNGDGELDARDYIFLKKLVLNAD